MQPRFDDKVVVVTGAATGIGREVAAAFAREGGRTALIDVNAGDLEEATRAIGEEGDHEVFGVPCDVSERDAVARAFAAVVEQFGAVDVLVNNAGISSSARFVDLTDRQWDDVMAINAKGAFLCSQAAARLMLEGDGGAIVNVSSQAAKRGQALISHYCASKAAVIGLTRALARELAPAVRVNAVCPGVVRTAMVERTMEQHAAMLGTTVEDLRAGVLADTPLGRLQSARSVADAILFLAGATDITGEALNVSGGMVMD